MIILQGSFQNIEKALKDPRVKIYEVGGDILQTDILSSAMKDVTQSFILRHFIYNAMNI